ncbi:hypothetical protein RRG08_060528 [Elysia crispata]|uniref:Fibrinogen C-terminal domain-containing protein n=1 Tax=Elysia crispata TaxID=231223 RepID=A0AAE1DAG3_9GAST|nr:hypothetical protein RRG08_060528 [Elysia crispata]
MKQSLFLTGTLCLIVSLHGLDLTMNRKAFHVSGARSLCGVLTCEEIITTSVSSTSDKHQVGTSVAFGSIVSLSILKRVASSPDGNSRGKKEVLLGSVTSQASSLSQVANGRKMDGLLEAGRATMRVELVKQDDCQAEFVCQVRGLDTQGTQVLSSASLMQNPIPTTNKILDVSLMPAMSLQLLTSLQQLISQSVRGLEEKIEQVQKELIDRSSSFETRLDNKLNFFENRIEDKIDNNNNLNKLIQLDSKVSTELDQFHTEAKADIMDSLHTLEKKVLDEQQKYLKNISEKFERTLNNTADLLSSIESGFDLHKTFGEMNLVIVRNETEAIREMLTSGEVSAQCLRNDTTKSLEQSLPVVCERYMNNDVNKVYPKYIMTPQFTLKREILCDTQTDGGGWTVIQRRTKGDVFFNRDWASYREGFGKLDGDFWLGNEAIHILTYVQPHELGVEIQSGGKAYFARYTSFKLESESDKYRNRLGTVTGSLNNSARGLSYSNNMAFSTFDADNDKWSSHCAISRRSGWWYNACEWSRLNAPWETNHIKNAWNNGGSSMHATRTEMKIRPLK